MDVKLDILNAMLAAIGSSGITSTIGRHPGLLKAEPILDRHNRTLQARGHWFNTDWGLKLTPSADNQYVLPENTLKADTTDKRLPFVRRGRYLYDPKEHTDRIDTVTYILVDVVIQLDYDLLPITAIDLLRTDATLELVRNSDADAISLRSHEAALTRAIRAFETERLQQQDVSLRDNPQYARIIGGGYGRGLYHKTANRIGG